MEGPESSLQATWPPGWGSSAAHGNAVCTKPCLITMFLPDPIKCSSASLKDVANNVEANQTPSQKPFLSKLKSCISDWP